jgi:hypothetical protein
MSRGSPELTPDDLQRFLDHLEETANVSAAAQLAGVGRRTMYERRDADPEFAAAWMQAVDRGTDALEDEAVRRAHEGVDEPVFYQGTKCGLVRKYSDTLLIFMLKARRPEKFKDRVANEHSGPNGGPVAIETIRRVIIDPRQPDAAEPQ